MAIKSLKQYYDNDKHTLAELESYIESMPKNTCDIKLVEELSRLIESICESENAKKERLQNIVTVVLTEILKQKAPQIQEHLENIANLIFDYLSMMNPQSSDLLDRVAVIVGIPSIQNNEQLKNLLNQTKSIDSLPAVNDIVSALQDKKQDPNEPSATPADSAALAAWEQGAAQPAAHAAVSKDKKYRADVLIAQRPPDSGTDIIHMDENKAGRDFIVGDIHGAHEAFDKVVQLLGPNDRLFIVGDLTDRGSDSLKVMGRVMANERIHVVRGNHEELFLKAINVILKNNRKEKITNADHADLAAFLGNGGDWILEKPILQRPDYSAIAKNILSGLQKLIDLEKLKRIKTYVDNLPYIRAVGDIANPNPKSFLVCHADMPFDDVVLMKRIAGDKKLNDEEKAYVTWARTGEGRERMMEDKGRKKQSIPAYCGHNIVTRPKESPVREETNHRNLDFGAFEAGVSVVVNHTEGKVVLCVKDDIKLDVRRATVVEDPSAGYTIQDVFEIQLKKLVQVIQNDQPGLELRSKNKIELRTANFDWFDNQFHQAQRTLKTLNDQRPWSVEKSNPLFNRIKQAEEELGRQKKARDKLLDDAKTKQKDLIKTRDRDEEIPYTLTPYFYERDPLFLIEPENFTHSAFADKDKKLSTKIAFSDYFYNTPKHEEFSHSDVLKAAYPDFEFAKKPSEKIKLLEKMHAVKLAENLPQNEEKRDLKILKARLEYRETLYSIRKQNKVEYTGSRFFRDVKSSATYKLAVTQSWLHTVNSHLEDKPKGNFEFDKNLRSNKLLEATRDGELEKLGKEMNELLGEKNQLQRKG